MKRRLSCGSELLFTTSSSSSFESEVFPLNALRSFSSSSPFSLLRVLTKSKRSGALIFPLSAKNPPRMMLNMTLALWCAHVISSAVSWIPSASERYVVMRFSVASMSALRALTAAALSLSIFLRTATFEAVRNVSNTWNHSALSLSESFCAIYEAPRSPFVALTLSILSVSPSAS